MALFSSIFKKRYARSTNSFARPKDWIKGLQRSLEYPGVEIARIRLAVQRTVDVNEKHLLSKCAHGFFCMILK